MLVVVAVDPVTTWMVKWVEIRLETAGPVQTLVKRPRGEPGEPVEAPSPPLLSSQLLLLFPSFSLSRRSVPRKRGELRQLGWPLVGAGQAGTLGCGKNRGPIQAQERGGAATRQTLETRCESHVLRVRQGWVQRPEVTVGERGQGKSRTATIRKVRKNWHGQAWEAG